MSVFCPCREPQETSIPSLLARRECYFTPDELLFCDACRAVRCTFCSPADPVAWFCTRCQAEFTKSHSHAVSNTCTRNCVRCPQCYTDLVVTSDGKHWMADCQQCEYKFVLEKKDESLAKECRSLRHAEFDSIESWVTNSGDKSSQTEQVPLSVPLRAKFSRKCCQCAAILAEPKNETGFTVKRLARAVIPQLEVRANHLVLRNFAQQDMIVRLAPHDSTVGLTHEEIAVPKLGGPGFRAPLFLVERETDASRHAYMSHKGKDKSGPGWACVELEVPENLQNIVLYASIRFDGDTVEPIGAWYSVDIANTK